MVLNQKVTRAMGVELIKPITAEEINLAMWSINKDKAPGPDGFNSGFFQENWDLVGKDVIQAVQQFFLNRDIRQWNATAITLVPKTSSPSTVRDYRPIACCNVVYKCVTKVLSNRLQPILPSIISSNQSAFVKGCGITDNVLLMQELVKNYHKSGGSPRCAVKMDLMKAYDSVDWTFLLDIMQSMQFPDQYIQWVKNCITTPMFSVMINGQHEGFFTGQRGLRQGDPLSPYLFLLVMEAFTALLQYKVQHQAFRYNPKCHSLQLTHLIFADDLFVLCGAEEGSFTIIAEVLKDFHLFSGLQINMLKSSVFFFCLCGSYY